MTQAKTKSFDLDGGLDSTAPANDIRVVTAVDADGNDVCGFYVVGKNSPAYQEASQTIRADALRRASKRKSALDATTEAGSLALAKAIDASDVALANAVLVGWFGFAREGMAMPFDAAVAKQLLAKYPTWREKVMTAVEADANFTTT